jgi:hypothetical protein
VLEDAVAVIRGVVWLALAVVVINVVVWLALAAVAVVLGSAETPVTVCTFPPGAVYTPETTLPFPPTSSW